MATPPVGTAPEKPRRKVLVLNTGGTIAQTRLLNRKYDNKKDYFQQLVRDNGPLNDAFRDAMIDVTVLDALDPLLDSSKMIPSHWTKIANVVHGHRTEYDGFVIAHGTDTLAYTAAAIAYMMPVFPKNIVLTASQIPLESAFGGDAFNNLLGAIVVAADRTQTFPATFTDIGIVGVYFNFKLMLPARIRKLDATGLDAFSSPNFPILAYYDGAWNWNHGVIGILSDAKTRTLQLAEDRRDRLARPGAPRFDRKRYLAKAPHIIAADGAVVLIQLFPGITQEFITAIAALPSTTAVIIQAFGTGNGPVLTVPENKLLFICTECIRGEALKDQYEAAFQNGVYLSDMTPEAAMARLYVCLGLEQLEPGVGLTPIRRQAVIDKMTQDWDNVLDRTRAIDRDYLVMMRQ